MIPLSGREICSKPSDARPMIYLLKCKLSTTSIAMGVAPEGLAMLIAMENLEFFDLTLLHGGIIQDSMH
jgi:hypothetical protein